MKAYNNFFAILNKAEHDGYIKSYLNFLDGVFRKELQYAINELNKLKQKQKRLDIRQLLENNIFIFKENLKLILMNGIEQVWGELTKKSSLDEFILKEIY